MGWSGSSRSSPRGAILNKRFSVYCKYFVGAVFRKWCYRILPAAITVFILLLISVPVSADPGLTVTNAGIILTVSPGQVITQNVMMSIANTDPATDISVSIGGVAQNSGGGLIPVDASHDTSPYTARPFVSISKSSFHLDPGQSQDITVTISVPQSVGNGGYYAVVHIATPPLATKSNIAIAASVNVPVYLTIKDSQLIHTGKITNLSTGNITSGQPVDILTDFQNTGNHHFKVKGEVTVGNASGQIIDTIAVPLTAGSVLPGMTRRIQAAYTPQGELAAGDYTISSKVMLEDGTVLDEAAGSFEVEQAYVPPPGTIAALSITPTNPAASLVSSTPTTGTAAEVNWTLIVGAVAGVIIIVLLVLLLRRRK
jgi:LPXTG-motif cell wall-anchored protein